MGGEFTVLNSYTEMLVSLARGRHHVRLVTNGYWAGVAPNKFFNTIKQMRETPCDNLDVAVSQDRWHERPSNYAVELLKKHGVEINIVEPIKLEVDDIVPIGRAWDNRIVPSGKVICSCQAMCNMIIPEDGMICKCPYGYFPWKHFSETTWHDAQDYIWGWRSEKLADGMNCQMCMETVDAALCRGVNHKEHLVKEQKNVW